MTVKQDAEKFKQSINIDKIELQLLSIGSTVSVLSLVILFVILQPSITLFQLMLGLILHMSIITFLLYYYNGQYQTQLNMAFAGFNLQQRPQTEKLFGWNTYEILRADEGNLLGYTAGNTANPFETSQDRLTKSIQKQRKEASCKTCNKELFTNKFMDSAYFVEERKQFFIFYFNFYETKTTWDAYCEAHKPKDIDSKK